MIFTRDLVNTLLLILVLGLILVFAHSRLNIMESFTDAVQCGVNVPCDVGLKCINGFCAKTERLRMYEQDTEDQAESSGAYSEPSTFDKLT
jgi:hypothetical protein